MRGSFKELGRFLSQKAPMRSTWNHPAVRKCHKLYNAPDTQRIDRGTWKAGDPIVSVDDYYQARAVEKRLRRRFMRGANVFAEWKGVMMARTKYDALL